MIRAVLDSNVYISALLFGRNPRIVIELAQVGAFETFTSAQIVDEIEEVLRRKFGWSQSRIRAAAKRTWRAAAEMDPEQALTDCPDPDDNRVLECAVAGVAHFIVTGDRDLLQLQPYRGVSIMTPRVFLDAVRPGII